MPRSVPYLRRGPEWSTNASGGAGGRLRVHVVSDGCDPSWNVQFPRSVCQVGARHVVDALHTSQGGLYRVRGEMKRLVQATHQPLLVALARCPSLVTRRNGGPR
ncbi:hypothetical protein GCM10010446_52750 [Streptomyces enissocaesilis]|uniref:Uncharacterized protein n=1 Tax=Streptomyces enissocaesilis TaxID=332589 RepID=A0ABP6K3Z3_9ACTN